MNTYNFLQFLALSEASAGSFPLCQEKWRVLDLLQSSAGLNIDPVQNQVNSALRSTTMSPNDTQSKSLL